MGAEWLGQFAQKIAAVSPAAPATCFHDWELMTGYETSCRRDLTAYALANVKRMREVHILVGSKLVAMGVSATSLAFALAGLELRSYTDRDKFEKVLAAAL